MAGQPVRCEFSKDFQKTAARFRFESPQIVEKGVRWSVYRLQLAAIKEARNQLKIMVYDNVLPPSVEKRYPEPDGIMYWTAEDYRMKRRVGTVWNAVKRTPVTREGNVQMGDVFVDPEYFPDFYYAWLLNNGGYQTRNGTYPAKKFWTVTETRMKLLVGEIAAQSAAEIIENLEGRTLLVDIPEGDAAA